MQPIKNTKPDWDLGISEEGKYKGGHIGTNLLFVFMGIS